jgi:hypothetical protein
MRELRPMKDRVLVQRIPTPDRLVVLTDVQTVRWGKVVRIGPKVTEVKPGDIIMLPGIAAEQPDFIEDDLILVEEGDIGFKVAN